MCVQVVIARHCVHRDPKNGLSPLQHELLHAPAPVRIAVAPTGAGKSYVFQRAMLDCGARVLFVVPTRRLAQNLLDGLERLLAREGWPDWKIKTKTGLWTSDGSLALREAGKDPTVERLMQILGGDRFNEQSEFYVATAESLSHLLVGRRPTPGQSDIGLLDVLDRFDHIVFDEFHTLEPAGFAFAAVLARATTAIPDTSAKLTFLSATPVDLVPALTRVGVPPESIASLEEEITTEGHALHGDVRLVLTEAPSLADLLLCHRARVHAEIADGRKVVLVYDQLWDGLFGDMARLAAVLTELGIAPSQVLRINSIDDSGDRPGSSQHGFAVGRHHDPGGFNIIVATASIEMGVNLDCAFMLMEPGFSPLSFLQRYGRAARGDIDGMVVVRTNVPRPSLWLTDLVAWGREHDGQRRTIGELAAVLGNRLAQAVVEGSGKNPEEIAQAVPMFGSLPVRAAFIAGLYWQNLIHHKSVNEHRRRHLEVGAPVTHRLVMALLRQVVRDLRRSSPRSSKRFVEAMLKAALRLRSIGETIKVHEKRGEGRTVRVPMIKLMRHTDILLRYPVCPDDGELSIVIEGALEDHRLQERRRFAERIDAIFPHEEHAQALGGATHVERVQDWCKALQQPKSARGEEALEEAPQAIEAAERLVRLTGLIPTVEEEEDDLHVAGAAFSSL